MPVIGTGRRYRPVCGRPVCGRPVCGRPVGRSCQLDMIAGARHDLAGVMRWSADSENAQWHSCSAI